MTTPGGKPLFTFAIISDTHVRPPGGDQSSPFPVNLKANARARHAVAMIAAQSPQLTIHLGDMVHPMPSLPTFQPAAEEAKRIFAPLMPNLHYVPGNHDIGDKPMKAMPAEFASEESLALYDTEFGPAWKSFEHSGCRFVLLNSSIINRGLAAEEAQWRWLEAEMEKARGQRTFAFIHYPPFITEPTEASHYDNIDEPGRARLLSLLARGQVEAVFSGHVHQVFFNRHAGMRLYVLPPTSFIRQDYAEMFRVSPAPEYGRDDAGKYGVTFVDVLEHGHRVRIVPTDGIEAGDGAPKAAAQAPARGGKLTAHLRHDWATPLALPFNGPMEEFSRKRARNDGLLIRLWQMGIRTLRTPLVDLLDPATRARMEDVHATGIVFKLFTMQPPDLATCAALHAARHMISELQIVSAGTSLEDLAYGLANMPDLAGLPVVVGKSHSSADEPRHGSHFAHAVSFGFKWEERDAVLKALRGCAGGQRVTGLAFQINREDDVAARLAELDSWAGANGLTATANVRMADPNPAVANFDDQEILTRVKAAVSAAERLTRTSVEIDTLMDVDRGYNPRHGLLDRLTNLRPAGRWLAGLA